MHSNLSGRFGEPYIYVFSPSSTKPKYRIITMDEKEEEEEEKEK